MALSSPPHVYPPALQEAECAYILSSIKDWSLTHGLTVRPPVSLMSSKGDPNGILATSAPVTVFPSPFPRVCFEQAKSIQRAYNLLYARIAQDEEFLKDMVEDILEVDEFIAQLWQIHLRVKEEGYTQRNSLGLFRSDYMVHQTAVDVAPCIKQVEFNTISSSFGGLSSRTSDLHRYLARAAYPSLQEELHLSLKDLPSNASTVRLADGLICAYNSYHSPRPCCIIFLVSDTERNIFDQRALEHLLQQHNPAKIPTFRVPFSGILAHTTIADTPRRELYYHHLGAKRYEVAVVYFRAGYSPEHYQSDQAWAGRLQIERSHAIKCPSILTHLAGSKRVQQILATPTTSERPSILSRFIPNVLFNHEQLSRTFTNIYPLDDSPLGLEAQELATDPIKCTNYVLKPQREGGGNNIYRNAIPSFLASLPRSHWKSYILMQIITPPSVHNMILRHGIVEKGDVICELGIYGMCLWDTKNGSVLLNEEAGHLLRTKGDKTDEGGVAAGFGAMDSCLLV